MFFLNNNIQLVILLSYYGQEHTFFFCVLLIWEAGIYSDKSTWHFFLFMKNFPFYFFSFKDTELNKIVHHQKKMTKGWKFVCSSSSSSYSSSTPDGTSQHQRDFQSGSSLSYQRGCRHGDHILCSRPWKSLFRLQTRKKKDRNELFAFLLHLRFDRRKAAWGFIVRCIAGGGGADPDASQGLTSFLKKTNSTVCAPALHSVHSHRLCAEIFMGFKFPPLCCKRVDSEICALCVGLKKKS